MSKDQLEYSIQLMEEQAYQLLLKDKEQSAEKLVEWRIKAYKALNEINEQKEAI